MNERRCEQVGQVGERQAQDIDAPREGAAQVCDGGDKPKTTPVLHNTANHAVFVRKAKARAYYLENVEKIKAKTRAWALNNKARVNGYKKAWKAKNKDIVKAAERKRRARNPEKFRNSFRSFYQKNRELMLARNKIWNSENREWRKAYYRKKTESDPEYKIAKNLRSRIRIALFGNTKSTSTEDLLGCSFEFLKFWLESKWKPGMSWGNYGPTGWHIDHIRPLASFDLTSAAQQQLACHFLNLQPLWAHENFSKSDRY